MTLLLCKYLPSLLMPLAAILLARIVKAPHPPRPGRDEYRNKTEDAL